MVGRVNLKGFFPSPPSSATFRHSTTPATLLPQWQWMRLSTTTTTTTTPFTGLINSKPNPFSTAPVSNAAVGIVTKAVGFDQAYMQRADLQPDRMPKHVTVTLDGNRRWCQKYNNHNFTYVPFYNRYLEFADICIKLGIPLASWFIFSTCTFNRSKEHNNIMFTEFQASIEDNLENFVRKDIKVSILGEKWKLSKELQESIEKVEGATKNGKTLHMMYAIPYGGRSDIIEATVSICRKVMAGEIQPEDIDEALVAEQLPSRVTTNVPDPDFMIRNGAKQRISNFYLWQSAYADLYFSNSFSAEFGEAEFLEALRWFQQCEKRFGK